MPNSVATRGDAEGVMDGRLVAVEDSAERCTREGKTLLNYVT